MNSATKFQVPLSIDARFDCSDQKGLWRYRFSDIPGIIEFAFWCGPGPQSLRPHFHEEAQITIVLSGLRAFRIDGKIMMVSAGQGIVFPAGQLHTSIFLTGCETKCINLYLSDTNILPSRYFETGKTTRFDSLAVLEKIIRGACVIPRRTGSTTAETSPIDLRAVLASSDRRIGQIAADFQISREGFSRRVKRELDVAPHSFRIISRLNTARRLLRSGQTVSAAAAEAKFSDQSHLTRLFREAFGTTPGRYQQR